MPFDLDIFCLDIPKERSSLIKRVEYSKNDELLAVYLRYKNIPETYENIKTSDFDKLCSSESIGKYYLNNIKPNFKQIKTQIMERPKTKNQASDKTRFIDISINVREIKKEWLVEGEKGTYLNLKLIMKPDGEVDKYGNLGMIVQNVPSSIYKAAEAVKKGSGKDIKGPILGNAAELDWESRESEGLPGMTDGVLLGTDNKIAEDLPF